MASLDQVRHSLDMSAVNRAVDLLTQAKKSPFRPRLLSGGRSRRDEQIFRFNVPVIYSDDIVLQRMSCMNCDDDDVVVIISHTGRTKSTVELAQLARENDAMVIALTSAGTPLAGKPRSPLPLMCRKIPTSICRWSPVWPS
nr:DNA-binding transcriptional regulator HexR [Klebsiella pneumoniae]